MTDNTGKKSRERRKPYNYLDKKGTTLTRQDYIETGYVNGVKGLDGELAMRPLNEAEKQWLSQFIAETDHGNFSKSSQLKKQEKVLKVMRTEYRKLRNAGAVAEMLVLSPKIQSQYDLVLRLREEANAFYVSDEERQELWNRDYERRMDVYNTAKISDNLVLYDLNEYDKFSTEAEQDINPENICMEHLHYVPKPRKKKDVK
jgi:hypothetical protein